MAQITKFRSYTCSKGWSGSKRHIATIDVNEDGTDGQARTYCSNDFSWNGTKMPTMIKKEEPTIKNITCKKCLERITK